MNRIAIVEDDQGYRDTLFTYIKPVSYTHLDVYKRQFKDWPDPVLLYLETGKKG